MFSEDVLGRCPRGEMQAVNYQDTDTGNQPSGPNHNQWMD